MDPLYTVDERWSDPQDVTPVAPAPPEKPVPLPAGNRTRLAAPFLLTLCVAALGWHYVTRGSAQMLGELPTCDVSRVLGMRGGEVLLQASRPGGPGRGSQIVAWSVDTGRMREVAALGSAVGPGSRSWLVGDSVYTASLPQTSRLSPWGGVFGPTRVRVQKVPLGGGASRVVCDDLPVTSSVSMAVAGDSLYWVRERPARANGAATCGGPIYDLVARPAAGGPTRVCAREVPLWTTVEALEGSAVQWSTGPGATVVQEGTGRPVRLGAWSWGARPVRVGSRWCWLQPGGVGGWGPGGPPMGGPAARASLHLADADGTHERTLAAEPADHSLLWAPRTLAASRGRVYVVMTDSKDCAALCALDLDGDHEFRRVASLPGRCASDTIAFAEGGYYYLIVRGEREDAPFWSTSAGRLVPVYRLYRLRLPA